MPIHIPPQANELLTAQGKAIASRQGAIADVDPRVMRGRVSSGRWQRLQRGVYAAFSGDPARETLLWAALLRAGPDAVLSHQTAAERHGLIDTPSPVIIITVPASRHPAQVKIPGMIVHRSDAILRTRHPAMLPPCTRVEDTVLLRTLRTSSGVTSAATTPTWSAASSRSGSASPNWAITAARAPLTSPPSSARAAGQALPTPAAAHLARSGTQLHDHGQKWPDTGQNWPRS